MISEIEGSNKQYDAQKNTTTIKYLLEESELVCDRGQMFCLLCDSANLSIHFLFSLNFQELEVITAAL